MEPIEEIPKIIKTESEPHIERAVCSYPRRVMYWHRRTDVPLNSPSTAFFSQATT